MTSRATSAIVALLAGVACSPAPPDPRVQAIVDRYAPGLRLGERVGYEARRRYKLRVTPYTGYTDTSYVARQGLRGLSIKVDEYVDDGNRRVSPDARIEMISLRSRDSATTASVESELRAALGAPSERCYLATATRWRRLYWTGDRGRGVLLLVAVPHQLKGRRDDSIDSLIKYLGARPGTAYVTFGAEAPSDKAFATAPCS